MRHRRQPRSARIVGEPPYNDNVSMTPSVSHDRSEETAQAKARWFRSLPLSERMALLCEFTDLALSQNPDLPNRKHAQPAQGRIQVISRA